MSNDTERDARLRLYAEFGESRQYLGPHNDEIGARELIRADVASLLKERDALAADYAQAIGALRKYAHAARVVVAMKNGRINNKALREAATEIGIPLKECAHVLSTPRAKGVE